VIIVVKLVVVSDVRISPFDALQYNVSGRARVIVGDELLRDARPATYLTAGLAQLYSRT
jgi:hypothetical protein